MSVDFKQALNKSGIPTTEAELKKAWEKLATEQGSTLSNTSAYSPFWRIITALVTKPVLWLLEFLSGTVLPNFFVKTATGSWLDTLAWAVNVERKGATVAAGELLFTRANTGGVLEVPVGTRIFHSIIVHHEAEFPIQLEERFVLASAAPDYGTLDFTQLTPNEYLTRTAPLERVEHRVRAEMPDARTRGVLGLNEGEPILRMTRQTWSSGRLVSHAWLSNPGTRFELSAAFAVGD